MHQAKTKGSHSGKCTLSSKQKSRWNQEPEPQQIRTEQNSSKNSIFTKEEIPVTVGNMTFLHLLLSISLSWWGPGTIISLLKRFYRPQNTTICTLLELCIKRLLKPKGHNQLMLLLTLMKPIGKGTYQWECWYFFAKGVGFINISRLRSKIIQP